MRGVELVLFGIAVSLPEVAGSLTPTPGDPGWQARMAALELKVQRAVDLEAKLEEHEQYIGQLKATVKEQATALGELHSTVRNQGLAIRMLESKVAEQTKESDAFRAADVQDAQGGDATLRADAENQNDKDDDLVDIRSVPEPTLKRSILRTRQSSGVAFTAYLDHNVSHLGIDQPIVYNKVLTNVGTAYNPSTGTFVCPEDGVYLFHFTVAKYSPPETDARLLVDGQNQVVAIADPMHAGQDAQGGNLAILQLTRGQSVWVATFVFVDEGIRSDDFTRFATFSGVML